MNWYNVFLFFHITCAVIWLGAGFLLQIQATRASRSNDRAAIVHALRDNGSLAPVLFIPASFGALAFGVALVIDGGWGFDQLWIILGLIGFFTTFAMGLFILKPRSQKIAEMVKRDGGLSDEALAAARKLLVIGRIDLVILYAVVANMALKPTAEDVTTLAVMGVVIAAAIAAVLLFAHSAGRPRQVAHA
ncbi:MAG TPA: DUF2269 family protein [Bauldia sp.]|nr:DUF2269 family protein [Bauldia sp.]